MTAVQEFRELGDGEKETLLRFDQFDIILPRLRLKNMEICNMQEQNTFNDPLGHFVECRFEDTQMVEFLAVTCIHLCDEAELQLRQPSMILEGGGLCKGSIIEGEILDP